MKNRHPRVEPLFHEHTEPVVLGGRALERDELLALMTPEQRERFAAVKARQERGEGARQNLAQPGTRKAGTSDLHDYVKRRT